MTLTQLEYFCAVCRCGSISKAAEELYVSHPTISVALKSLEKEFSLQLFVRSGNRLSPTRDGEAFYRKAQAILAGCDEMYADFARRPESSYHVHVGVPPIRSCALFPELLERFHEKSKVPVVLHEYSSKRSLEKLDATELDCCLVNAEDAELGRFETACLLRDHFVFLVASSSPLAEKKQVSVQDLADVPLILQNGDSALNAKIVEAFDAFSIAPHILLYSSQVASIAEFVGQGLAGAFLYSTMAETVERIARDASGEDAGISAIPFAPEIESTFALVWPKGGYMNSNVRTWIDFVQDSFRG
ncbi:MAG: LysR family transcriptional regulator [Atopobiaceae bacterium]